MVKNRNFGQKSKFWSKIEILAKMENLVNNFGQKLKIWSNILDKNRNIGERSNVWSQIEILVKTRNIRQKLENFCQNFCQKSECCQIMYIFATGFYFLTKISVIWQHFHFRRKCPFLEKIQIFEISRTDQKIALNIYK